MTVCIGASSWSFVTSLVFVTFVNRALMIDDERYSVTIGNGCVQICSVPNVCRSG